MWGDNEFTVTYSYGRSSPHIDYNYSECYTWPNGDVQSGGRNIDMSYGTLRELIMAWKLDHAVSEILELCGDGKQMKFPTD